MSGHWPPEWEDLEEEFPEETDQSDATALTSGDEARLSEVAAYLASVPVPVLPDAVEARITAALAAEAATRTDHATPAADASRRLAPRRIRTRGRRPGDSRRPRLDSRSRPLLVVGSLVVCLFIGLGFALAHGSTPTYSGLAGAPAAGANHGGAVSAAAGSAGRSAVPSPAPTPVAAASATSSSASSSSVSSASAPKSAAVSSSSSSSQYSAAVPDATAHFVVITSGSNYQQATLAGQVRARLEGSGVHVTPTPTIPAPSPSSSSPGASASSSTPATTVPTPALRGCVLRLTGGVVPQLVDRATYQGEPAYVIASSSHVWVVGLGCTADTTELITSVPLAGLPGNLHGLVSVVQ